ncbi:MAG TPA: hypothetical protein VKU90_09155 [Caulobacteraceae bacterium]|nr:hypothetical protein [Caulobacteraceae bacterium]
MTAVRYPVARTAEAALAAPLGRAARASEAEALAGGAVAFVSELAGPAFSTRDDALAAFAGRLDDERPGHTVSVPPQDRYCALVELAARPQKTRAPMQPVYAGGRRWPKPRPAPATLWRLSVRYWRVAAAEALLAPSEPRPAPRRAAGKLVELDARALRERLAEPLRPVKPQQPLDIGLFEYRPPEAPHIVIPDE